MLYKLPETFGRRQRCLSRNFFIKLLLSIDAWIDFEIFTRIKRPNYGILNPLRFSVRVTLLFTEKGVHLIAHKNCRACFRCKHWYEKCSKFEGIAIQTGKKIAIVAVWRVWTRLKSVYIECWSVSLETCDKRCFFSIEVMTLPNYETTFDTRRPN